MKKVLIVIVILVQAFFYHACDNSKKPDKSTVLVNESDVDDGGKAFMKAASLSGIMEVELAKIAQQNAASPTVKEFAEMMISDHTRIFNELKKLATDKHILLPIELEQEQIAQLTKLKELNGTEFDRGYMRLMVRSHEQAVKDFEAGARNRDPQVNKLASDKLETLKEHLSESKSIFNKIIVSQ